jgi:hypothetical protein
MIAHCSEETFLKKLSRNRRYLAKWKVITKPSIIADMA